MTITTCHMDAFTGTVFAGHPAMVCVLDAWPDDARLQALAAENHLPATTFQAGAGEVCTLRWFSPTTELELCGHGTLAASAVIFDHLDPGRDAVRLETRGGTLAVSRKGR